MLGYEPERTRGHEAVTAVVPYDNDEHHGPEVIVRHPYVIRVRVLP
jgi:hypothetical protein